MEKGIMAALGLFISGAAVAGAGVRHETGEWMGRPSHTLDNGIVAIAATPEIGGRIFSFALHANGFNALQPRVDNWSRSPDDDWGGGDYGGVSDLATTGWPGAFWGLTYEVELREMGPAKALRFTAHSEDIGIDRWVILRPESSLMTIAMAQSNRASHPIESVIRLHAELGVGQRARTGDRIFYPTEEGVASFTYTIGAEHERFRWLNLPDNWLAITDPVDNVALVRRFLGAMPPFRIFFWVGFAESPELLGYDGAFYAVDWFGQARPLRVGASHEAREEFFLIDGLPKIDWVKDHQAGAILLTKSRFGQTESVQVRALSGSAMAQAPVRVVLELVRDDGDVIAALNDVVIPGSTPGQSSEAMQQHALTDLPDGKYFIRGTFFDEAGERLGSGQEPFEIASALQATAQRAWQKAKASTAAFRGSALYAAFQHRVDTRTELNAIDHLLVQIENQLAAGQYEDATAESAEVERLLSDLEARLKRVEGA